MFIIIYVIFQYPCSNTILCCFCHFDLCLYRQCTFIVGKTDCSCNVCLCTFLHAIAHYSSYFLNSQIRITISSNRIGTIHIHCQTRISSDTHKRVYSIRIIVSHNIAIVSCHKNGICICFLVSLNSGNH